MIRRRLGAALALLVLTAQAPPDFTGDWRAAGARASAANRLHIAPGSIRLGKALVYRSEPAGAFGDGALFRIAGSNRRKDPLGCGLSHQVRFIAIKPLPAILPGQTSPGIRVYFYAGTAAPTEQAIDNDINLCSIRPFHR